MASFERKKIETHNTNNKYKKNPYIYYMHTDVYSYLVGARFMF